MARRAAPSTYTCKCNRVSVAALSRVPGQSPPPLIRDSERGLLRCRCGVRVPWSVKVKLKRIDRDDKRTKRGAQ